MVRSPISRYFQSNTFVTAGKFTDHCFFFLEAGYRLILPDLPSHGRSSGLHVYLTDFDQAVEGVRVVLEEVQREDKKTGRKKGKWFIAGASFGGWVASNTAWSVQVHASPDIEQFSGVLLLAP
ncbi:hypothetical protein BT69DRAFT_1330141, partial [Atractiella rhizophila]